MSSSWMPRSAARLRFQLPGGILLAVLLPALLRSQAHLTLSQSTLIEGGAAAAAAIVLGGLLARRMGDFPGVQSGVHIPIVITGTYSLAALALLLLRLEYSRSFLVASYLIALGWFVVLHILSKRFARPLIAIVPGGHASTLTRLDGVAWRHLARPPDAGERLPFSAITADLRCALPQEWERFLVDATLAGTPVYHSKALSESLTGKVEIEHLYENSIGAVVPNMAYLKLKFLLDWLLAFLLLPVFLLVGLGVGALIFLESGRPIFYRQERMGFRGRVFKVYKFRTMRTDTAAGGDAREAAITRSGDARITALGGVLRRYRIDELPQLLNILKGEMSWIGPRPEAIALSRWYEAELPYYHYRHAVRPGISGWAQVNQGHVELPSDVHTKLHYDFFYIKYLSPWLDMLIVFRTLHTILFGFGVK
ncbi:MAG: sugar transferase [Rhizobiales bacterium]|nr:sugar transferase [Hyphomicrobiales bacterium]